MNAAELWNRQIFLALNADLSTSAWKINVATAIADYLIFLIPVALIAMWCWGGRVQRESALKVCLVALIALGLNQLIALGYTHPRPAAMGIGHTFIRHAADSSFPSDHATVFGAIGLTLVFACPQALAGWAFLILGATVAWARIYLGVHFPMDMLGAVASVLTATVVTGLLWNRIAQQCTDRAERLYRLVLAQPISLGWIRR